jgi:hypothetical protein
VKAVRSFRRAYDIEKARRCKRLIRMTRRADSRALKIHRCLKHLCRMRRRGAAIMPRRVMGNPKLRDALKRITKSGLRRTLTSCDFVETNRRQNCGAFFSCGKSWLFRGGCVAARKTRPPRISEKISADLPRGGKVE